MYTVLKCLERYRIHVQVDVEDAVAFARRSREQGPCIPPIAAHAADLLALDHPHIGLTERLEELRGFKWTAEQFRKKNLTLAKVQSGIHLSDRCPLDPLTFGRKNERRKKASYLLQAITDGNKHSIERGHLIYLDGSVDEIRERGTFKHKHWSTYEIGDLVEKIEEVYGKVRKTVVCTRGRTVMQVSKELAKVIFLDHL